MIFEHDGQWFIGDCLEDAHGPFESKQAAIDSQIDHINWQEYVKEHASLMPAVEYYE